MLAGEEPLVEVIMPSLFDHVVHDLGKVFDCHGSNSHLDGSTRLISDTDGVKRHVLIAREVLLFYRRDSYSAKILQCLVSDSLLSESLVAARLVRVETKLRPGNQHPIQRRYPYGIVKAHFGCEAE